MKLEAVNRLIKISKMSKSKPTYEVEKVLEKKVVDGKTQYRVKWKNYPLAASTWEPASNLIQCQQLIYEFHEAIGGEPVLLKSLFSPATHQKDKPIRKLDRHENKISQLDRYTEKPKSKTKPARKITIEIEDDDLPQQIVRPKKVENKKRKLQLSDSEVSSIIETPETEARSEEPVKDPLPKNGAKKSKDEKVEYADKSTQTSSEAQKQPKILGLYSDLQQNIFFKLQQGDQVDMISRSSLMATNIILLITFYQSRIEICS